MKKALLAIIISIIMINVALVVPIYADELPNPPTSILATDTSNFKWLMFSNGTNYRIVMTSSLIFAESLNSPSLYVCTPSITCIAYASINNFTGWNNDGFIGVGDNSPFDSDSRFNITAYAALNGYSLIASGQNVSTSNGAIIWIKNIGDISNAGWVTILTPRNGANYNTIPVLDISLTNCRMHTIDEYIYKYDSSNVSNSTMQPGTNTPTPTIMPVNTSYREPDPTPNNQLYNSEYLIYQKSLGIVVDDPNIFDLDQTKFGEILKGNGKYALIFKVDGNISAQSVFFINQSGNEVVSNRDIITNVTDGSTYEKTPDLIINKYGYGEITIRVRNNTGAFELVEDHYLHMTTGQTNLTIKGSDIFKVGKVSLNINDGNDETLPENKSIRYLEFYITSSIPSENNTGNVGQTGGDYPQQPETGANILEWINYGMQMIVYWLKNIPILVGTLVNSLIQLMNSMLSLTTSLATTLQLIFNGLPSAWVGLVTLILMLSVVLWIFKR